MAYGARARPIVAAAAIKDATHFVLFEKPRFEFFGEILKLLPE